MPFTLTLPKLSPTMEEGTIAKWHKKVGDYVAAEELLMEVATDKAVVEYKALDEGYLRQVLVPEGGTAIVNQPVAIFTEKKDESINGYKPEGSEPEATAPVAKKRVVEQPVQAASGTGMVQPAFVPEAPLENYRFAFPIEGAEERVKASPLARKMAREKGLDLTTVQGSGPHERVVSRDLETAQPDRLAAFGRRQRPKDPPGSFEEIALTPMRKTIGRRLQESKTFVPHFYVTQQIDAEPMTALREQLSRTEIKVTFNDFVLRACALCLREHPEVNTGFHSVNQSVIQFKTIDIAVAVNVDGGLVTPIIRHADYKNIGQISVEVKQLVTKAKASKLAPEEYRGGSFTVSNLGMYGVNSFQAIINPPQAAILAVGAILDLPVVKEGKIVAGKQMALTLSADHRVIDGTLAAQFLKTLKQLLENPAILLV